MNGAGDLAMSQPHRKYLYPRPEPQPVFTVIKITRKGLAYIQATNGEYLSLPARNINPIEYCMPKRIKSGQRTIACEFTLMPSEDIRAMSGIDIEQEMMEQLTKELLNGTL